MSAPGMTDDDPYDVRHIDDRVDDLLDDYKRLRKILEIARNDHTHETMHEANCPGCEALVLGKLPDEKPTDGYLLARGVSPKPPHHGLICDTHVGRPCDCHLS